MKKIMYALTITSLLLLSSCGSSISSEDYAAVVAENTKLKAEIESLSAENQSLSDQNEELLDAQTEQITGETIDIATTTWINTSFGDDSILLSDTNQKYLQCIAGNTYPITNEGIAEILKDLSTSLGTVAYVEDSIPYDIISIRFLDPSGECILDVILDMNKPKILTAVLYNNAYASEILSAYQEIESH
ncbi:MAG: bZIP transcription factor [Eubacterium sp.]|nr:bZIP transcription factor [Eubacterium sp.]